MIDYSYCKGCKWLRWERKNDGEKVYSCYIAQVILSMLCACPMKEDNCYK